MKSRIRQLAASLFVLSAMSASAAIRFVNMESANPTPPYTDWTMAATTIQDAVDAAVAGDQILVTNGVYQTGGRLAFGGTTNRVAVDKPVTLQSVNGAAVTLIQGDTIMRCVYLVDGAALEGFTLANGVASEDFGGGVWCESTNAVVSNCILTGSWSENGGGGAAGCTLYRCTLTNNSSSNGGGAWGSTLYNCTLTDNQAGYGGGADSSTLNNCTIVGNGAFVAGGANHCTLNNCIVYYNSSDPNVRNYLDCSLSYSCTTPLPTNGIANFANEPLFLDQAGGNLRLQSNSPCINAGSNASASAGLDLDGGPRIAGGTVDIGAYEFQSPQSLISYAWLQQYGLPTDGSVDVTDTDGDGMNNWQEWRAGTNPTDALSALRLLNLAPGAPGLVVKWQSMGGRNYFLERSTLLGTPPILIPLAAGIVGQPDTTTFTDTNAVGTGPFFYRVGVQE